MSGRIELGIFGARRAYELLSADTLPSQFELLAVCETDTDEYAEFAPLLERLGISVFSRFTSMLEAIGRSCAESDFDALQETDGYAADRSDAEKLGKARRNDCKAIFLAGSPKSHAIYSQKALGMGFDVLCEPPVSFSPADAYRIERAVHGGHVFALAEPECFSRNALLARSIILSGKLGAVRFAQVEHIEQLEPNRKKAPRQFSGPIDCSAALGVLLFVTGLRVRSLEMTMQSRLSGGKCELYSLGVELCGTHGGAGAPGSANANCVYGTLGSAARRDLRIYCENGSVELHGKHIMLHDCNSSRRSSALCSYEGLLLPGMAKKYRSEQDYRQALMLAGFALRVLKQTRSCCIELYDAFDITLTGIMARRMLVDGTKQRVRIPDLRIEADRNACRMDKD